MAHAKKCDRCGEYYDCNTYTPVKRNENGRLAGTGYTIIGIDIIKYDNDHLSVDQRLDLCDDCIVNLFKFLCGEHGIRELEN